MKYMIVLALTACMTFLAFAQPVDNPQSTWQEAHHLLLAKCARGEAGGSSLTLENEQGRPYSLFLGDNRFSLYTCEQGRQYLLCAERQEHDNTISVDFTLYVFASGSETPVAVSGNAIKSPGSFTLKLDDSAQKAGYSSAAFLETAMALTTSHDCCCDWWQGALTFDPVAFESRTYYATRQEAVNHVSYHVSPKYCFVWRDGSSSRPWRPIPGTGCAHWVAHQKGIHASPGCYDRYAIRVSQVTRGKRRLSLSQAQVGDIWTNGSGSHCGIVIGTGSGYVRVRHCSSGSGGVVVSNFYSGYAYR